MNECTAKQDKTEQDKKNRRRTPRRPEGDICKDVENSAGKGAAGSPVDSETGEWAIECETGD